MKTAAISGSHGLIGTHLTQELTTRGYTVVSITQEQLASAGKLKNLFEEHTPELIFHLAAYGNHGFQTDESQMIISNYFHTFNMLEASKDIPYQAFIFASTSSVYGQTEKSMQETDQIRPNNFYSATKAGAEYLCQSFAFTFNKPVIIPRFASVYGEYEAGWRLIPTLCRAMVTGESVKVVRWPEHSWIYAKDAIDALFLLIANKTILPGRVINISNGETYTNDRIMVDLSLIADKALKTDENAYVEPPHHSKFWLVDNKELTKLGYKPKVTLEEGLKKCWDYYKEKYEKE